jgi:hypothetical protein
MVSHSLPAIAVLAFLGVIVGRLVYGSWYVAKILALLVVSHLLGDLVTGIKPTVPGGPVIGLGVYAHPLLDFFFESAVIIWGWWMYRSTFRPSKRNAVPLKAMLVGLLFLQAIADVAFVVVPRVSKCG